MLQPFSQTRRSIGVSATRQQWYEPPSKLSSLEEDLLVNLADT